MNLKPAKSSLNENLQIRAATAEDAKILADLHSTVADYLTNVYGRGPWSSHTSEKGILFSMRHSLVFVLCENGSILATFHLASKKPWAIDVNYFTKSGKPLYLLAMAVIPDRQRQGIGRRCIDEAISIARSLRADSIRLDANDANAGAGPFYERCGFIERGRVVYRKAPLIYYELIL